MSSEFRFVMLELPSNITSEYISELKKKCDEISLDTVQAISALIEIDTDSIDISNDIKEEDLFHLGEERLKIRKAVIKMLQRAVGEVLYPVIDNILKTTHGIKRKDIAYIDIKNSTFAVSGDQKSYYSKADGEAYEYLLALNVSKILD